MRWTELTVDADEARQLPGYRDPAVVRTFDAPEALDTRFYEVRAKSVINRVPEQSQVPFRWTINPYRGCSHACTYCSWGETPILLADGKQRAIADLRRGDAIVGTELRGNRRYFVSTLVLDHWTIEKPAFRVTLADGTELISSGDHRFLSKRGWRYVTKADPGIEQRQHLRLGSRLIGTGRFASPPVRNEDYRRGYLCGLSHGVAGEEETIETSVILDRMSVGSEVLPQVERFLVTTGRSSYDRMLTATGGGARRWNMAASGEYVEPFADVIRWPVVPSDDWRKGFLAGLHDACGYFDGKHVSLSPDDSTVIGWAHSCLTSFGFDVTVSSVKGGPRTLLINGTLGEQLRFCHTVGPAGRALRRLDDVPVKTTTDTRVVSVEPLGQMRLYDVTTGTGDFIANGVVSHNCFARPTHTYLDMDAGRDFEKEIVVKVNAPEVLRAQLAKPSWKREHIAMGTNTDPYQWVEGRYKLMRGIWEALRDFRNPCSILTKSPLLLRDLDLMLEIAEHTTISANLSIPTLDEKMWRATEPHTPNPRARIEAVAKLNEAGIPTGVLIAPLMPGINDAPEQVEEIVRLCQEAGAVSIGGIALHLRREVKGIFFDWLRAKRPDLIPRYEQMYRRGAYAPTDYRERVARLTHRTSNWPRRYLRDRQEMEERERELEAEQKAVERMRQPSLF